jgi:hypothetical protein
MDRKRVPQGGMLLPACACFLGILFTDIAGGQSRYPAPPPAQTPANSAAPADANAAANANPAKPGDSVTDGIRSGFDTPAASTASAPASAAGTSAPGNSGAASNPFRNPASAASAAPSQPRTIPLIGDESRPITDSPRTGSTFDQRPSSAAGYEVPPTSQYGINQQSAAGSLKPSAMMRAMLTPPNGSQLRGQPLALVDLVSGASSRAEQTQRVEAYWDLCSSVADYYLGLREQDELRRLRSVLSRVGPNWQTAETELNTRVGTSQRAALASQLRIASYLGRGTAGYLPLPADIPHCATYTTHYERIFSTGAPQEARELAALLPQRYIELRDASTAVTRAEDWLDKVARTPSDDETGSLRALELLALRRRAFVQIARDYNRRIARYSELASPGQVTAGRLTGMLIKSTASTATLPTSPAPPPNRRSGTEPPRTFVENSAGTATVAASTTPQGGSVQQTSAMQPVVPPQQSSVRREETAENGEHSVLVKPQ